MCANTTFVRGQFGPTEAIGRSADCPKGPLTTGCLGGIVLGGSVFLSVFSGAALTRPAEADWAAMTLGLLALWLVWLLWRNARDEVTLSAHMLHPFLAAAGGILLGHLLAGAHVDATGRRVTLLAGEDSRLLIRLMRLTLMLLLTQDLFSRLRDLRWPLTSVGAAAAVGGLVQLHWAETAASAPAVALTGLTGAAMLLVPCFLPAWPVQTWPARLTWLERAAPVGRIVAAAALIAMLALARPQAVGAALLGTAAVGGALLAAAACLNHHRARLALIGAGLALVGALGLFRVGIHGPAGGWAFGILGADLAGSSASHAELSGLAVLGVSAGWAGLGCILLGIAATIVRCLLAGRNAAPGDQARAALWAAVVALSGCALLAEGGLAVPATTAVVAVAWGLMPHVTLHRARRVHGWPMAAALAAALMVLGLGQRPAGDAPAPLPDKLMHFLCGSVFTAALLWQGRCRRWWQGLLAAVPAAAVLAASELLQPQLSHRAFEWSDLGANELGVTATLAAFLLIRAASQTEARLSAKPSAQAHSYRSRRPAA